MRQAVQHESSFDRVCDRLRANAPVAASASEAARSALALLDDSRTSLGVAIAHVARIAAARHLTLISHEPRGRDADR